MTSPHFINKDAEFLWNLSQKTTFGPEDFEALARLATIAKNLESLDQKSAGAYSLGFREGQASVQARSNILKRPDVQPNLKAALASFRGEVKKVAPVAKKEMKEELTLDDLDFDD